MCEGGCIENYGKHLDEVQKVLVRDKNTLPIRKFTFNYCQNAIDEDIRRGFDVIVIDGFEQQRLSAKAEHEPLDIDELDYLTA